MQVESGITKYEGRVPPLDLSTVNNLCSKNNELNWIEHHCNKNINISNNNKKNNSNKLNESNMKTTTTSNSKMQAPSGILIKKSSSQDIRIGSDGLPLDPRDWTRADVWKWLINTAISEGLDATPDLAQKFPMNGKALCLMSLDMYLSRVPVGGKMLYRDFRVRLARAMSL